MFSPGEKLRSTERDNPTRIGGAFSPTGSQKPCLPTQPEQNETRTNTDARDTRGFFGARHIVVPFSLPFRANFFCNLWGRFEYQEEMPQQKHCKAIQDSSGDEQGRKPVVLLYQAG